jgi:hypothetical protein
LENRRKYIKNSEAKDYYAASFPRDGVVGPHFGTWAVASTNYAMIVD